MDEEAPVVGASQPLTAQSAGSRGTSQSGVGLYNERLILSLIRRQRSLAKVEIARLTGLSTQTTTVIINRLEVDGLLLAGEPQRGRIGQPSVPYTLNPDGAFGLGLMIGRRSCDLVLMDFTAGIRARRRMIYPYPCPERSSPSSNGRCRTCWPNCRSRSTPASAASASRCRSSSGTGRPISRRRRARSDNGAISMSWPSCPAVSRAGRSASATTRPRLAPPSSPSVQAAPIATSPISMSGPSSAAASSSTAACFPVAAAMPAHSGRCRSCVASRMVTRACSN